MDTGRSQSAQMVFSRQQNRKRHNWPRSSQRARYPCPREKNFFRRRPQPNRNAQAVGKGNVFSPTGWTGSYHRPHPPRNSILFGKGTAQSKPRSHLCKSVRTSKMMLGMRFAIATGTVYNSVVSKPQMGLKMAQTIQTLFHRKVGGWFRHRFAQF